MRVFITTLLVCLPCFAQLPDVPSVSREHKLVKFAAVSAAVSGIGIDAFATCRNVGRNGHEANPVARPFFDRGTATTAIYFAASAGAFLIVDHELNRKHKRLAKIFDIAVIVSEAYATAHSFTHYRM